MKRYRALQVGEHDWIVGVVALDNEDTPTVVTEKGARDWADRLNANDRGAVSLTPDEVQCLTCAMAGNFPEQFEPIRAGLLRKLFKAHPYTGGQ